MHVNSQINAFAALHLAHESSGKKKTSFLCRECVNLSDTLNVCCSLDVGNELCHPKDGHTRILYFPYREI